MIDIGTATPEQIAALTPDEFNELRANISDEVLLQRALAGDFVAYCEYCFADSATNEPWTVWDYQKEWNEFLQEQKKMVVWAPMQSGKCIKKDTVVRTLNDGHKFLCEVKPGDKLLSINEEEWLLPNKCVYSASTGKKQLVSIGTKDGHSIVCSPDHKILTGLGYITQYKAAGDLQRGDTIICQDEEGTGTREVDFMWTKNAGEHETWDLQMEDPYNNYVAEGIVTHNSEFMSLAYPIWRLGRNHNELIISVSDTAKQATKWLLAAEQHIVENQRLHEVFPTLRPAKHKDSGRDVKWGEEGLKVERDLISGHFSWQAVGSFGSVLGSRASLIVVDDAVDYENSRTQERRQELTNWVQSELLSRLFEDGQMIILGTTWAKGDLMHDFSARKTFFSVRYSVDRRDITASKHEMDGGTRLVERPGLETFLAEKRAELPQYEFARQYRNRIRATTNLTFPSVTKCFHFLETDDMSKVPELFPQVFENASTITSGVDLSSAKRPGNAIVVTAKEKLLGDKSGILNTVTGVKFGNWTSPATARQLAEIEDTYGVDKFTVESNGYQESLKEWMEEVGASPVVESFRTGEQKYDAFIGLPSLEAEFENNRWKILLPAHTKEVVNEVVRDDCDCDYCRLALELIFHPTYATSDGVMALWFARGRKKRKKTAKMRFYDPNARSYARPNIKLSAFRLDNRISKARGFQFPENSEEIVRKYGNLTISEAEKLRSAGKNAISLDKTSNDKYYLSNLSESEGKLIDEMIHYCRVLQGD